ncbi:MAG TPA: tetratricopeptide repeat protein [Sumerlaeia bacterium]|nr:tetratricopeptide repeat protein [Sumerlaeia bacterium]
MRLKFNFAASGIGAANGAIHPVISRSSNPVFCLALLATLPLLAACREPRYIIPAQKTAEEQYSFAVREDNVYRLPINKDRQWPMSERAMAAYRKVIEEFPENERLVSHSQLGIAMILDRRGDTLDRLRDERRALKMYKRLLETCPDDDPIQINSLFGTAAIYDKLGKYERAKECYRQILDRFGEGKNPDFDGIVATSRRRYQKVHETKR